MQGYNRENGRKNGRDRQADRQQKQACGEFGDLPALGALFDDLAVILQLAIAIKGGKPNENLGDDEGKANEVQRESGDVVFNQGGMVGSWQQAERGKNNY